MSHGQIARLEARGCSMQACSGRVWTTPLEKVQSGPWPKKGKTILQSPTAEIMGPEAGAHGYIKGVCGIALA